MILLEKLPVNIQNTNQSPMNLQTITIWVANDQFIIQPNYKKSLIPTLLKIDRKNKIITQIHEMIKDESAKPYYFSLLIGILNIGNIKVIVLAQQADLVCTICSRDIFKISKPIFLFFDPQDKQTLNEQQAKILVSITAILQQGMYFSFSYDLTLLLNYNIPNQFRREQFNWAQNLQKPFASFNKNWLIPVIQGFVGFIQIHLSGQKFSVSLISRRSTKRSGTQDYGRGIDKDGNVGNFVQTQQIVSIDQYLFSFLQIRGSAPLYWQLQGSYGGMIKNIQILKTQQQNKQAFQKHLAILFKSGNFNQIGLLNLLNQKKIEKKLIQNYQYLIKKIQKNNVKYAYFDIHNQCSNKDYSKFNFFLENKLKNLIESFQFTALKIDSTLNITQLNLQKGVLRTNCLDCIDRSNIAQFRVATLSLIHCLKHLQIKDLVLNAGLTFLSDVENPFVNLYQNLWADNGDYLSKQYTGTGSTQSFAVRKGKISYLTTLDHGMKSLARALRNINNQDEAKNYAIQFLLGIHKNEKSQQKLIQK